MDDSTITAMALADAVALDGTPVGVAHNGKRAYEQLDTGRFSLVFMDYKLPDTTGLDIYRWLRANHPSIEFVLTTGYQLEHLLSEVAGGSTLTVLQGETPPAQIVDALAARGSGALIATQGSGPSHRASLLRELSDRGFAVRCAAEPLQSTSTQAPATGQEVAVIDASDDLLGSLAQLALIRRATPTVPVIVLLRASAGAVERTFDLQAHPHCIVKPVSPRKLMAAVERWRLGLEKR
ncbi:MAG: response regulator [Myxococcales bacterium]|nr:response regulator [Myxococcales bacterium]